MFCTCLGQWHSKFFFTVCLCAVAFGPLPLRHSYPFCPERSLWPLHRNQNARFEPNWYWLVWLGWSHGFHTLWPGIGHLLGVLGPTSTRIHRYQHSSGLSGCKYFFLLKYVQLKSLISDYALENCLLHIGIILMPLYNSLCKLWQRGVGTVQSFLCSNDLSKEEVSIEIMKFIC